MDFRIADISTHSYAKLTGDEQKLVGDISHPSDRAGSGRIAVKVVNHSATKYEGVFEFDGNLPAEETEPWRVLIS